MHFWKLELESTVQMATAAQKPNAPLSPLWEKPVFGII
jgi:hypothetical protein